MTAALVFAAGEGGGHAARGTISFDNAAQALRDLPPGEEIDLAALERTDSATLAVLIGWAARARRAGRALRYRNAPAALRNLAHLSAVDELLGL